MLQTLDAIKMLNAIPTLLAVSNVTAQLLQYQVIDSHGIVHI